MSLLEILQELQATHDHLRTIDRDLSAFPPDLASLDQEGKSLTRQLQETEKQLVDLREKRKELEQQLEEAQRAEEVARKAMKAATQKVQYAAAIRDLDDRERQKAAVARPLKDAVARCAELEVSLASLRSRSEETQARFQELHQVFLSEHENQVVGRERLLLRRKELESSMTAGDLVRFQRLLQTRQGRAVVPIQGSTCTGCQVKLRVPFLSELRRNGGPMICESCQRIVFIP
ncbi:MAG: hypothetical protein HY823_03075 [Acidobacteria bacterium]|nr:hypothetical protein [Acidobacteriota bacterium]